jgi:isoleucyl-tRNA synthetase
MSSNIVRGGDARISDQAIDDVTRQVMLPIWNAYSFFTLYANADGYRASFRTDSSDHLDRYILAKTQRLVASTTQRLDAYDLAGATAEVQTYLDALTNWYIRRSRERFWNAEGEAVDHDALDTLHTVLVTLATVIAPLLPMLAEELWQGLVGEGSVHLASWPAADHLPADDALVDAMDLLRAAVTPALALREERGLRVRLPLRSAVLAGTTDTAGLEPLSQLLADEINVKSVEFSSDVAAYGEFRLVPNARVLGPRLGGAVQQVIKAAKSGDWTTNDDGTADVGGHRLLDGEFSLALDPKDGVAAAALPGNGAVIVLDVDVTPELEAEGMARDLVRVVQQARKDAGFNVSDRIRLTLHAGAAAEPLAPHLDLVAGQVLATSLDLVDTDQTHQATVGDATISFALVRVG